MGVLAEIISLGAHVVDMHEQGCIYIYIGFISVLIGYIFKNDSGDLLTTQRLAEAITWEQISIGEAPPLNLPNICKVMREFSSLFQTCSVLFRSSLSTSNDPTCSRPLVLGSREATPWMRPP